jgi:hypothetical protein
MSASLAPTRRILRSTESRVKAFPRGSAGSRVASALGRSDRRPSRPTRRVEACIAELLGATHDGARADRDARVTVLDLDVTRAFTQNLWTTSCT